MFRLIQCSDWGQMAYQSAWEKQELIVQRMIEYKRTHSGEDYKQGQEHHLIFVEHPPVFTLGRNGDASNLLLSHQELDVQGIQYYEINRGGDITFHGPGQLVIYPLIDLDCFFTDIGRYIRYLEQVVIDTLAEFAIDGGRIDGLSGVWIDSETDKARKICAVGVHLSRWVTMHGLALNVNTDLSFFNQIVPCGISDKAVTSIKKECQKEIDIEEVKQRFKHNFIRIFDAQLKDEA